MEPARGYEFQNSSRITMWSKKAKNIKVVNHECKKRKKERG